MNWCYRRLLRYNSNMTLTHAEIFDMLGRLAHQTEVVNGLINLVGLTNGTYFLKCYGKEGVLSARVVKEN